MSGRFTSKGARGSRVHRGLVGEQSFLGTEYLADPGLRAEYERDIAPRTEQQLERVLGRLPADYRPARVLDLGAGTGAVGRVIRARYGPSTEVVAVDRVAAPGILRADLTRAVRPPGVVGYFDLVVAAHLLCELVTMDVAARARLVLGWLAELVGPKGTLILIEPALRTTGRDLLAVRDRLVGAGWFVVAPCLWQGPCPALTRARDWCHDSVPLAAQLPGRVGARVDFAYLVVQRTGRLESDPARVRIVSDLLHEKGRLRIWGCGPAGRNAFVLQTRDERQDNVGFRALARGDLARVGPTRPAGDGLRLSPQSRVVRD